MTETWSVRLSAILKAVKRENAHDNQTYSIYRCPLFKISLDPQPILIYNCGKNLALTVKGLQMSE